MNESILYISLTQGDHVSNISSTNLHYRNQLHESRLAQQQCHCHDEQDAEER
jgi:hypothetical protein